MWRGVPSQVSAIKMKKKIQEKEAYAKMERIADEIEAARVVASNKPACLRRRTTQTQTQHNALLSLLACLALACARAASCSRQGGCRVQRKHTNKSGHHTASTSLGPCCCRGHDPSKEALS